MMRSSRFVPFAILNRLRPFLNRFQTRTWRLIRSGLPAELGRNRAIGVILIVVLVATSSPSAPQSAARLSKKWNAAAGWHGELQAKAYRGLANGYARVESLGSALISAASNRFGLAKHSSAEYAPANANQFAMLVLNSPTNLGLSSASATSINLTWTAPSGTVSYYQIERSPSLSGSFDVIDTATSASYNDTSVTSGVAYLYRVRAVDSFGAPSAPSTMALGTAATFTDDPLVSGTTTIKASHVTQLRASVNAVRSAANLSAATWTDTTLTGVYIKAVHIQELRDRLGEALTALEIASGAYTDPSLTAGTTLIKKAHMEELRLRSTRGSSSSTGGVASGSSSEMARLDPSNGTGGGGENPLSRNFNLNIPLLGLRGRAGLDLGLSLSYNSLVWTKNGSYISFNDDVGFPSPGFRLGFPVIKPLHYNSEVGKNAFLLIGPDGSRTELRQVNTSALYEAADSSYLQLDSSTMKLRSTDGTQLSYALHGGDYQCTEIKDRNGNFITITYTAVGRISTVVDTLGRVITFNYNGSGDLTSITQLWNGQTHTWASFEYNAAAQIDTNFSNLINVGPPNGTVIKVLSKVILNDHSSVEFDYTSWGQVWKVRNHADDGHLLNYRSYNLPQDDTAPEADCPRFTQRRDWAENWNRNGSLGSSGLPSGPEQEVVTTFSVPTSSSWTLPGGTQQTGVVAQVTSPDLTYNKIYFPGTTGTSTGWHRGSPSMVETYDSSNTRQRQSVTTWTQDNTSLSYILNPRVTETNVYDPAGNRARKRVTYQTVSLPGATSCNLPQDVFEYQANATTVLRRTHTDYNLTSIYTNRRIIGLVSGKTLYGVDPVTQVETLMSKVGFLYDETGSIYGNDLPVRHDNTGYTSAFVEGRANLSSVKRYDVNNTAVFVTSRWKYNTAGDVVASIDPLNHQTSVNYDDSFSDGNNSRNTLAYPTEVIDPEGFASAAQYNFDFGAITRTQEPPPAGQSIGAIKHFIYDSKARIEKVAIQFNSDTDYSYVRFQYPISQNRVDTYTTIQDGLGEAHSFKVSDGHGRLIASASEHPGSTGGFSGQLTLFDTMGRVVKTSNPTETDADGSHLQWEAVDDDTSWLYTQQTYDWKGRPLVTTNTDTTTKAASYGGCGCAGGEVITVTDEGTLSGGVSKKRQKKIYADVLGRAVKSEVLNWNGAGAFGTGGTVYSAVVNVYNSRDQVTSVKQYAGAATGDGSCPSGTCQQTTMTYDGHGRLETRHAPEQSAGTFTTYNYNSDDRVSSVSDARGSTQTLTYNARHLVTGISYMPSTGIADTPDVTFAYDAAGNRTSMTDGIGSRTYAYNQLSRMTSETRTFTGLAGSFTLTYAYNLAGELTSFTDPFGALVGYGYDRTGRLSNVTGSGFASVSTYASNAEYRAWGAVKSLSYGNSKTLAVDYNGALQPTSYEVPGVLKKSYEYYNDGKLKFTQDQLITNSKFDRSYEYDHMGRVTKALSGAEARGQGPTEDRPYNESLTYDEMGHLTSKQALVWDGESSFGADDYVNNRVLGWVYDADGRAISTPIGYYTYDAAGRVISFGDDDPYKTEQVFNGEGQRAKTVARRFDEGLNDWVTEKITYYLTSTVLGGELVTEISEQGAKERTLVRAGGSVLASQVVSGGVSSVEWEHTDASGASRRTTNSAGSLAGASFELDAVGANAGLAKPFTWTVPDKLGLPVVYPEFADMITNPGGGCVVDGIPGDCDRALRAARNGAADVLASSSTSALAEQGAGVLGKFCVSGSYEHGGDHFENHCTYNIVSISNNTLNETTPQKTGVQYLPSVGSYDEKKEGLIRSILASLLQNEKCKRAFEILGLQTINETVEKGVVIGPATLLSNPYNTGMLGITESARVAYNKEFSSGGRAGTIMNLPGQPFPFASRRDQRPRMFFANSAFEGGWFGGESWLRESIVHEFIHAGGQPPISSWVGHDLSNYEWYDFLLESCK